MSLQCVTEDILWNLDILGSISNHQTLLVDGRKLDFDNRTLQWLRRPITGDSRDQILDAIKHTFVMFEEVLRSYQCNAYLHPDLKHIHQEQLEVVETIMTNLDSLVARQQNVKRGLSTLATFERYNTDSGFRIQLNQFTEKMDKLCEKCHHLKEKLSAKSAKGHQSCCFRVDPVEKPSER